MKGYSNVQPPLTTMEHIMEVDVASDVLVHPPTFLGSELWLSLIEKQSPEELLDALYECVQFVENSILEGINPVETEQEDEFDF